MKKNRLSPALLSAYAAALFSVLCPVCFPPRLLYAVSAPLTCFPLLSCPCLCPVPIIFLPARGIFPQQKKRGQKRPRLMEAVMQLY